jgi:hypothetical protein
MSPSSTQPKTLSFAACDRFFSIAELLNIFLENCSPLVLLNCTRVCRSWNTTIAGSTQLQQTLFLEPCYDESGEYKLNPIINSHFAPILGPKLGDGEIASEAVLLQFEAGNECSSQDIISLPWARETSMDAPTRRAFMDKNASWRRMLISQPPIQHLDWWHDWKHVPTTTQDMQDWLARRGLMTQHVARGYGYETEHQAVTLGMLWDLVESRIVRGCTARVQIFPQGSSVLDDEYATNGERQFTIQAWTRHNPFAPDTPRVKFTTHQIWTTKPRSGAGFDMRKNKWANKVSPVRTSYVDRDGFGILADDCVRDYDVERWSKSDGFVFPRLSRGDFRWY